MMSLHDNKILERMAIDMAVPLFARFNQVQAAQLIGVDEKELLQMCEQHRIGYLAISDKMRCFLGKHVLEYMLACLVPMGKMTEAVQQEQAAMPSAPPSIHPHAKLLSVKDTLALIGISRTKLYELLGNQQIESVKIGRRTLIKRTSLNEFLNM